MPRIQRPGVPQHVITRAPKGLVLFRTATDGETYLSLLADQVRERAWSLRTYCLMNNHLHLLLATEVADLDEGMKGIHERFAARMHKRYDGHGHVFGGRYENKPVLTPEHEIACLRYIARNPVKAGLCPAPEDYRWSAHRALAGLEPTPDFLDVEATWRTMGATRYQDLAATSDPALLDRLSFEAPRTWIAAAVDHHRIPVADVAARLGVSRATAYKRLRAARDSEV